MYLTPRAAIHELGDGFYDAVAPADFPQTILRFRNDRAAAEVGLAGLDDAQWCTHFGRFAPLPGSLPQPLALRYHGHQFRTYNPELGDGRGFLLAQLEDTRGRLLDLGTKGSGQTPWSRSGDGRLTLKGGVREILATEMLQALGLNTSKTFSLIETGEDLARSDEPSPTRSAVMVRLSHSHIRYGSFQRLAALDLPDDMRRLIDYVLRHYFGGAPDIADTDAQVAALIDHAVTGAAKQAAGMMAAGFVHGVLNTDNINITGECFDYGPYRFAPVWDPDFTAAYFDHHGLYSFGRQAEALQWNVFQLAGALSPFAGATLAVWRTVVDDYFMPQADARVSPAGAIASPCWSVVAWRWRAAPWCSVVVRKVTPSISMSSLPSCSPPTCPTIEPWP